MPPILVRVNKCSEGIGGEQTSHILFPDRPTNLWLQKERKKESIRDGKGRERGKCSGFETQEAAR